MLTAYASEPVIGPSSDVAWFPGYVGPVTVGDQRRSIQRSRSPESLRRSLGLAFRRSLIVLAIAGLGSAIGCGDTSAAPAEEPVCEAANKLDLKVSAGQRAALRERFLAVDKPLTEGSLARVEARLAAHLDDWRRARPLACSPNPAVRECIATRAQILNATLEALAELDAETLEFAVDAVAALDPASACARARALPGALDGERSPQLDELRLGVARARALARTGQVWAALEASRNASAAIEDASSPTPAPTPTPTPTPTPISLDGSQDLVVVVGEDQDNNKAENQSALASDAPTPGSVTPSGELAELASDRDREALAIDAATLLGGLLADTGDGKGALEKLDQAERDAQELGDPFRLLTIRNARAQVLGLSMGRRTEAFALTQRALTDAAPLGELADPELAVLYETRGLLYEADGKGADAELAFKAALEIHRRPRADGLTTPAVPAIMNHLGTMLIHAGRHDEACTMLERALRHYREEYGEAHPILALPLNNLGLAHQREGRYVEAQVALEHALELQEDNLGPDHPRLASTLDNLGLVTRKLGSFSRARECSQRAIELYSQSLGPDHLRLVAPLRNLGNIARERGELAEALELLTQALTIQERESDDARALAHALHDLANVYGRLGDLDSAQLHFERALGLLAGALGADHPDLKGPLIGLGNIDRDRGELVRAKARYERALELMRAHFGDGSGDGANDSSGDGHDDHPEIAVALFNLGNIHKDLGHLDVAEEHYRQALAIRERALREDHPLVIKNLTTLGKALVAGGQPEEGTLVLQRALSLSEGKKTAPEELAALRFLLARVLWDTGKDEPRASAQGLAEAAAAEYTEAGADFDRERRTIERWLAKTKTRT